MMKLQCTHISKLRTLLFGFIQNQQRTSQKKAENQDQENQEKEKLGVKIEGRSIGNSFQFRPSEKKGKPQKESGILVCVFLLSSF